MNLYYTIILLIIVIIVIIFIHYDDLKIWILNRIVLLRGILSPNCFWYKISDLLLTDGAGINLYNKYKDKYGDFAPTYMFHEKIYLVTNIKYIKIILDNSPNIFSVGKLKETIFKSFMGKNVGVSTGCPWKRRRYMNETALNIDKLHIYAEKYNNDISNYIKTWKDKSELEYNDFLNFGKYMVAKIVFNVEHLNDDIFKIFSEANNIDVFSNPDFKIDQELYNNYLDILNYYIDNPNPNSLIELCLSVSNDREEVLHQIPHFIFPLIGLFITTIPRLLVLLFNHKNILIKVIQEINSINTNNKSLSQKIYKLSYLRKCILETLRLINPLITTFRTLSQDFSFDNKYYFKKGTQFLILNNPVLRETEYFKEPNKFIPSRWTPEMEKSYYAISFNQGPQRCPAKELVIFLSQSFVYNFIKIKNINNNNIIKTNKIDTNYIPQIINPCDIKFIFN